MHPKPLKTEKLHCYICNLFSYKCKILEFRAKSRYVFVQGNMMLAITIMLVQHIIELLYQTAAALAQVK